MPRAVYVAVATLCVLSQRVMAVALALAAGQVALLAPAHATAAAGAGAAMWAWLQRQAEADAAGPLGGGQPGEDEGSHPAFQTILEPVHVARN